MRTLRLALVFCALLVVCGSAQAGPSILINPYKVTTPAGGSGTSDLTWEAPVRDIATIGGEGGALLSDLAGFKVYKSSTGPLGPWSLVTTIANPATVSYTVPSLTSGTWYFCVSSYDSGSREGDCTRGVVSRVIP